jgi:hypothetical protein
MVAVNRAGYLVGALLFLSGLVHLGILVAGGGSWEGPLSLRKPMTFGFSFGLTLVTMVWVSQFVALGRRTRSFLLAAFTAASVLETTLVSIQAWRGVPSHFNVATPLDAAITRGLAGGGVALVAMVVIMTLASFRSNRAVPASLRLAVRTGFVALCGAMIAGGVMIARGMTLVTRGNPQAAYLTAGSLKPVHAVTMHGILVLPALAWTLAHMDWSEEQRVRAVVAGIVVYVLVAAIVLVTSV